MFFPQLPEVAEFAEEIGMLDNLTGGRVIIGFMRGALSEDQVYGVNPAEGRGRLIEGMELVLKALRELHHFLRKGATTNTARCPSGRGRCNCCGRRSW